MNLPVFLTEPPKPTHPAVRYGFLMLCVGLLVWHASWVSRQSWPQPDARVRVIDFILLALLLNHVAFRFPWPRAAMIALRVAATIWVGVMLVAWLRVTYR